MDFKNAVKMACLVMTGCSYALARTDNSYWLDEAKWTLYHKLNLAPITGKAKNIIMFLGDGMGVSTLTAARFHSGRIARRPRKNPSLAWDQFPCSGLAKTYCVDKMVADSACSATAYLNGVKGNKETIGINAKVSVRDCAGSKDPLNRTSSILEWAQKAGKATGVVTTARVTDASPSGTYAHTANRRWESDADIAKDTLAQDKSCNDIAKQLITSEPGKNINVILGGGRQTFLPSTTPDHEGQGFGERLDGQNLIEQWKQDKTSRKFKSEYVFNRTQLLDVNVTETDYLLGLFEASTMRYHLETDPATEPTLAEMTKKAIRMLRKEKKGFFLFVEGGLIDKAHHENWAQKAVDETIEMSKAVDVAISMTKESDTLIVVTADHSHAMTLSGDPGIDDDLLTATQDSYADQRKYTSISYAQGLGYRGSTPSTDSTGNMACTRFDLSNDLPNNTNYRYRYPATVPRGRAQHAGEDVAVFARGPSAHLFTGTYEQNAIPVLMGYSAAMGPAGAVPRPEPGPGPGPKPGPAPPPQNNAPPRINLNLVTFLLPLAIMLCKRFPLS